MTTVAQLIAKLQTLPQDAEVECGKEKTSGYETYMTFAPVDLEDFEVVDYTSEEDQVKYPKFAGKVFVKINAV